MKKWDKILHQAYVEIYNNSYPKASFEELLDKAEINERGQKVIDFMSYEIDLSVYNDIVNSISKQYRLSKSDKRLFNNTLLLGATPKFTKNKEDDRN